MGSAIDTAISDSLFSITFAPMIPWWVLLALGTALFAIGGFGLSRRARGSLLRISAFAVVVLTLAGPRTQHEQHTPQDDVAIIVVDRSPSQMVENRTVQSNDALARIEGILGAEQNLEVRIATVVGDFDDGGTHLMETLSLAAADIPANRFAGAILITDGQVHDSSDETILSTLPGGPIHTLLSGEKQSNDRRIVIEKVPAYGLVGQEANVTFRVEQTTGAGHSIRPVTVTLAVDGKLIGSLDVRPGRSTSFQFTLEHADKSIIELSVEADKDELSLINNTGVASINGVRDRLRVLLISGQPHAGERMWRNLLKSDPAVDLIHFTILRPPGKSDFTPIQELSLITFPTLELFDLRIKEFDLIVFDRYSVRHVLSPRYFRNIGNYMRDGGAILLATGPEFAGTASLYETALGPLLPVQPTGSVIEEGFLPQLTDAGLRHPVTSGLTGTTGTENGAATSPEWGQWLRQIETVSRSGSVLMQGIASRPLLILDRVEKGRIGVLTSDHIWLWARGYDGGGPQAELVRRLAHWLMKEPALEEERLSAVLKEGALEITRRSLGAIPPVVSIIAPTGQLESIHLESITPGRAMARYPVSAPGVYRISDGELSTLAAVGSLNPIEYRDLRATDEHLRPLSARSGGGTFWLSDKIPEIRRVKPDHRGSGTGWIGLRANHAYVVSGVAEIALLPWWSSAALVMALLFAAWWREGR